ncbi:MAG: TRAP transporter small permease [Betaproteobacteria bacterium]|nr:TRAP transporter small permease [Betaproteobacteria bacterium]
MNDSLPMRIFVRLNDWLAWLSAVLVAVMMITVVYDVLARKIFSAPTLWVIDVNEYLLVYATFIPAAWILLRDSHVKVELVVERLGARGRRVMDVIANVAGLFYCVILAWQGTLVAWQAYAGDYHFSTALAAPQWPIYAIIPLGSAWLGLAFLFKLLTAAPAAATADNA